MFKVIDFLEIVPCGCALEIYDSVFRLSGEKKLLWSGRMDDQTSVPESLWRCKVLRVAPGESYVLKIWTR